MTKYLIGAVLFAFIGYGFIEAWPLISGPTLSIDIPRDHTPFPSGIVAVRGRAAYTVLLTLNGMPLVHEENGDFSSTLTFPRGGSILTFVATDRFGRSVSATRSIFVP